MELQLGSKDSIGVVDAERVGVFSHEALVDAPRPV